MKVTDFHRKILIRTEKDATQKTLKLSQVFNKSTKEYKENELSSLKTFHYILGKRNFQYNYCTISAVRAFAGLPGLRFWLTGIVLASTGTLI